MKSFMLSRIYIVGYSAPLSSTVISPLNLDVFKSAIYTPRGLPCQDNRKRIEYDLKRARASVVMRIGTHRDVITYY